MINILIIHLLSCSFQSDQIAPLSHCTDHSHSLSLSRVPTSTPASDCLHLHLSHIIYTSHVKKRLFINQHVCTNLSYSSYFYLRVWSFQPFPFHHLLLSFSLSLLLCFRLSTMSFKKVKVDPSSHVDCMIEEALSTMG